MLKKNYRYLHSQCWYETQLKVINHGPWLIYYDLW